MNASVQLNFRPFYLTIPLWVLNASNCVSTFCLVDLTLSHRTVLKMVTLYPEFHKIAQFRI